MANKNDERILKLREQIAEKKDKLGKISRFVAVTNCLLQLDGVAYNLNVLDQEKLRHLLIRIHVYSESAIKLKLEDTLYSGYTLSDWSTDIGAKLDILSRKVEERKLAQMEEQLSKLLSDEKQVELEIDAIASLLND